MGSPSRKTVAADYHREKHAQATLLRDIFGNPFHPVRFDPAWRRPSVLSRAQLAYNERRLPAGTLDPVLLAALGDVGTLRV